MGETSNLNNYISLISFEKWCYFKFEYNVVLNVLLEGV